MVNGLCFLPLKTRKAPEIKDFCVRVQNCCTNLESLYKKANLQITAKPWISSTRSVAYHQFRKELHIIKAERFVYHHCERRYTLTRDDIQRRHAAFDDIHRTPRGDDIPLLSQWIEKRASRKRCSFFWLPLLGLNQRPHD